MAVAFEEVPANVTLTTALPVATFLTVARSDLDVAAGTTPNAAAVAALTQYQSMTGAALWKAHVQEWESNVWVSGIEVGAWV